MKPLHGLSAAAQATTDPFRDARDGEHLVRLLEASLEVQRRHQFFNWAGNQVHALAPHRVLVCGQYQRQRQALHFDCFYTVPLSQDIVTLLSRGGGELLRIVCAAWTEGLGRPLALELARLADTAAHHEAEQLRRQSDCPLLLVHGVSRPQRPEEIESLFAFACPDHVGIARHLRHLSMTVPTIQATWRRVQAEELDARDGPAGIEPRRTRPVAAPRIITEREREILNWVREGLSNQQIAERLGISALTVKNHVQKLLRKLGAGNRAQAVALAMSQNLLGRSLGGDTQA
jgi:transcriptional regulator EpsA